MVSLVLVSHSYQLAQATLQLVRAMSGDEIQIEIAAGAGDDHEDLGTDAMEIHQAILNVMSDDGVIVMMDMGSAVLSTDMALDFLDEEERRNVRLCASSFVEGSVAAGVACKVGSNIDEVLKEASNSLQQKIEHIAPEESSQEDDIFNEAEYRSISVRIPMLNGLHARPATQLIQVAAKFENDIKVRNISKNKGPVSARSMTGLMSLEALFDSEIQVLGKGENIEAILQEIKKEIELGLGDDIKLTTSEKTEKKSEKKKSNAKPIGIASGIVIGKVFYPKTSSIAIPENLVSDIEREIENLKSALAKTKISLQKKAKYTPHQGDIFNAQAILMDDPELLNQAMQLITNSKFNAPKAWWITLQKAIEQYRRFDDENLRQRALDLEDAAKAVLVELGIAVNESLNIPEEGIIIVEDITPAQVDALDGNLIKGVICLDNGQTSHSSILLRSRSIPSIVLARGNEDDISSLSVGSTLVMNGDTGKMQINPTEAEQAKIKEEQEQQAKQKALELADCKKAATTKDGKTIEVFANIGNRKDAESAAKNGADGIGLLRTEFMFLERSTAPTEKEQEDTLRNILEPMKGKPIIIRTLDAGGDKAISYLDMPKEENPFLGVRAIRLCLNNRPLFQEQLKATLRVSNEFDIRIMFPMIATLEELRFAKEELTKAHEFLVKEKIEHTWPIQTGMMMEVPSSAILANEFAKEVDFFSIGTNDLVQYTMAADRGNPELQYLRGNGLPDAVISLIQQICKAAKDNNIHIGVCGESAANKQLADILLDAGVDELSMNANSVPSIKYYIRETR